MEARLKWPNDVFAADRKLAGLLVERVNDSADPAAVVGVGLNVSLREDELPVPTATSLRLSGASSYDRDTVLRAVLRAMAARMSSWQAANGDAVRCGLLADYTEMCDTLGRDVEVVVPGGRVLEGRAQAVDDDGRLLVIADDGRHLLAAGDVVHVRRA